MRGVSRRKSNIWRKATSVGGSCRSFRAPVSHTLSDNDPLNDIDAVIGDHSISAFSNFALRMKKVSFTNKGFRYSNTNETVIVSAVARVNAWDKKACLSFSREYLLNKHHQYLVRFLCVSVSSSPRLLILPHWINVTSSWTYKPVGDKLSNIDYQLEL